MIGLKLEGSLVEFFLWISIVAAFYCSVDNNDNINNDDNNYNNLVIHSRSACQQVLV